MQTRTVDATAATRWLILTSVAAFSLVACDAGPAGVATRRFACRSDDDCLTGYACMNQGQGLECVMRAAGGGSAGGGAAAVAWREAVSLVARRPVVARQVVMEVAQQVVMEVARRVVMEVARRVVMEAAPRREERPVGRQVVTPVARAAEVVVALVQAALAEVVLAEVVLAVRRAARLVEPREESPAVVRVALRVAARLVARVEERPEAARPVARAEAASQAEPVVARVAAPRVVLPGFQVIPARSLVRRF